MNTAERRQALKDSLIAAAERTIDARGLAGLKARELASEVGCALGAIYNVFGDLDDLVLAVNSRTLAALEHELAVEAGGADAGEASLPEQSIDRLVELALVYLRFAAAQKPRWRALFEHRIRPGKTAPEWYLADQMRLFAFIERPLQSLLPEMPASETSALARTLFSAVHGIVALGLEEKLGAVPPPMLEAQTRLAVMALGEGLTVGRSASGQP